jgi:Xaa-Pro dipeptidase
MQIKDVVHRQDQLYASMVEENIDALILNPGPSLLYFTGVHFHLFERPILVIFSINRPPIFIIPELEARKVDRLPYSYEAFYYSEDPETWQSIFSAAFTKAGLSTSTIAIEPGRMRLLEFQIIETALGSCKFISGERLISGIRMIKSESEVSAIKTAVDIAQNAIKNILPIIKPGITEKQIANQLALNIIKKGSDITLPFSPIVSGGPNSANPHAAPTDRKLCEGDLLVIDWGASYHGYISDMTRTFAIGKVDPELSRIAEIVHQANLTGQSVITPEIEAGRIDLVTRQHIHEAGYGEYFTHRTGHGIGLDSHEAPYIREGNNLKITAGMVFTIEPGIYIPDVGGVRIEDDVIVTEQGIESLTSLPRNLIDVTGT